MLDIYSELSPHILNGFYIGGEWKRSNSAKRTTIISPSNQQYVCELPLATADEVDDAVWAARRALDEGVWPGLCGVERGTLILRLADALVERLPLLAKLWTAQVGAPISLSRNLVNRGIDRLRYYADLAEEFEFQSKRLTADGTAMVRNEAVGVAALIIPWSATFPILTSKLGPALAAGCTCIIKSPPESPLDPLIVAECADAVGIPPGVINVTTADREVSQHLIASPCVQKISFTGSVAAGRHIANSASSRMARLTLELGGKSAALLLDDVDLAQALPVLAQFTMPFSGQFCFSQTRILAPRSRLEEVVEKYSALVKEFKIGDPWDESTQIGPVLNQRQFDRVMGYIERGRAEGAQVVTGGQRSDTFPNGFFIEPTVFAAVTPSMSIAREEIFGPVVTIQSYETTDEAVTLANDTDFGLSGSVFSTDHDRAYAIACRLKTGQVGINRLELSPSVPFGGMKMSGIGREGGPEGLQAYLEPKSIFLPQIPGVRLRLPVA